MPRIYLVRHGETEWSLSGQHTGRTDIPLTKHGEEVLSTLGEQIVGDGKVLDPRTLSQIIKSPRQRAQKTFDLLFKSYKGERDVGSVPTETTEDVREWDYGKYEGIKTKDIQKDVPNWEIFADGCPEGESTQEMQDRVDQVVAKVQKIHKDYWENVKAGKVHAGEKGGDVLIVTHGHFSKSFLARWCELPISTGKNFIVDAGGLSVGSYDHRDLREPALQALNLYAL